MIPVLVLRIHEHTVEEGTPRLARSESGHFQDPDSMLLYINSKQWSMTAVMLSQRLDPLATRAVIGKVN